MKILITNYQYPGLVNGLTDLGHEVINEEVLNWWTWCWGTGGHSKGTPKEFGRFLVQKAVAHKVDVVIIGKGFETNQTEESVKPPFWHILPETIEQLKGLNIKTIWLSLDQPDDFTFSIYSGQPQLVDAIGSCCADVIKYYARYTKSPVFEFWPAWDQTLREITPDDCATKEHDFTIVGTPYFTPNDSFGIPRRDIALAALDVGISPTIYGPDIWIQDEHGGSQELEPYYKGFADWNGLHKIFAKSKITYNSFLRRGFRYVNDRIFIAGGSNTFLLMEEQLGLDQVFQNKKHVGYHEHQNIDDFKAKLEFWMREDTLREKCALNMKELITSEHTYAHRAKKIEDVLLNLPEPKKKTVVEGAKLND